MPLAFSSRSHGTIAFGFFNIHSDMLLLDNRFFFAERWCEVVVELARGGGSSITSELSGWSIPDPHAIGDLHGAIAGVVHAGFIGATYLRWPFPLRRSDFKQQPEGYETQGEVASMIEGFGVPRALSMVHEPTEGIVFIDEISFTDEQFGELVAYVDRGGYPRWRDELRPSYVSIMMDELRRQGSPWV